MKKMMKREVRNEERKKGIGGGYFYKKTKRRVRSDRATNKLELDSFHFTVFVFLACQFNLK